MAEKTLGKVAAWAYFNHFNDIEDAREFWQAVADAVVAEYEAQRWKPIESAPKDGTIIDLWVSWPHRDIKPQRLADCWWNEPLSIWSCLKVYDAGFVATHWTPILAPPQQAHP